MSFGNQALSLFDNSKLLSRFYFPRKSKSVSFIIFVQNIRPIKLKTKVIVF